MSNGTRHHRQRDRRAHVEHPLCGHGEDCDNRATMAVLGVHTCDGMVLLVPVCDVHLGPAMRTLDVLGTRPIVGGRHWVRIIRETEELIDQAGVL